MTTPFGNKQRIAIAVAQALGLAFAGPAFAEDAPPAPAPAEQAQPAAAAPQEQGEQLQEIVVTAQKRASTVDKTPISMTAISGEDLIDRGLTNFAAVAAETPGVSMKTNGPGQTEFEMRGMTSSGGNSPTVGFYLDDAPLTAPAAAQNGKVVIDPTLYDLNHVEVLRGPQGTLYGSSSMGGTIKLITNQPKMNQFEGSVQTILSGTDGGGFNHNENAMLNLPLVKDELALRLVASQASTSGWIDRIVESNFPEPTTAVNPGDTRGNVLAGNVTQDNKQSNAEHMEGGRATLTWKPTDRLTITPMVFYQRIDQEGPSAYDTVPGTMAHYQPFGIEEPYSDSITINSLNLDYKFDAFEVTSATSNWHRLSRMIQDGSENVPSPQALNVTSGYYGTNGTGPIFGLELDPSNQFSEELRAASTGEGPLKWVGGAYFAKFQSNWQLITDFNGPAFGSGTNNLFTLDQPTQIKQDALFGEATYSPSDKLHLTGGLRWYHYDSQLDMAFSGWGSATGTDAAVTQHVTQANSGVNPKVDVSYDVDKDLMVYFTAARGFRPGGGNQPLPASGTAPSGSFQNIMYNQLVALGYSNGVAPTSYKPDSLWSYEVGEKGKFLDGRLHANASLFFENWQNIQLEQLPFGYPLFDNVNSAHIYGGELELRALLTHNWTIAASGGYTHAALQNTEHGFLAGGLLPDVPKVTTNLAVNYHRPITERYEFTSRLDNTYTASRIDLGTYQGIANNALAPLPSYDITNFRAGVNSEDGWSAALFVNNLTNKHAYLENIAQLTLPNAAYNRAATNQPRTIGVDMSYHF
jgi:outer membrane receptor protein involved in Fe transport